jgi:hypothetical protein
MVFSEGTTAKIPSDTTREIVYIGLVIFGGEGSVFIRNYLVIFI